MSRGERLLLFDIFWPEIHTRTPTSKPTILELRVELVAMLRGPMAYVRSYWHARQVQKVTVGPACGPSQYDCHGRSTQVTEGG